MKNIVGGSDAYGINNSGWIVGYNQYVRAFLYDGHTKDLGTLGGDHSVATGINDSGQIVGNSYNPAQGDHAFLYDGGNMIDLNTLLPTGNCWVLNGAIGINDSGQIVGYGLINSQSHAFLMTQVPEPTTLLLLGLGAAMLRRKKH